jgi:hypothetical protein
MAGLLPVAVSEQKKDVRRTLNSGDFQTFCHTQFVCFESGLLLSSWCRAKGDANTLLKNLFLILLYNRMWYRC